MSVFISVLGRRSIGEFETFLEASSFMACLLRASRSMALLAKNMRIKTDLIQDLFIPLPILLPVRRVVRGRSVLKTV